MSAETESLSLLNGDLTILIRAQKRVEKLQEKFPKPISNSKKGEYIKATARLSRATIFREKIKRSFLANLRNGGYFQ